MTFVQNQESVEKGSDLRSEGSELPLLEPKPVKPRRKLRLFLRLLLVGIGMVLVLFLLRWLLVPGAMERKEIAPGVFLEVHHFNQPGTAEGAVMVAEIHWDTPEVEIVMRPFDDELFSEGKHYRLVSPSWEVFRKDYLLLMNGTLFGPDNWDDNYPGKPVKTNESVVVEGVWSHLHEHSYMLWWDKEGNGHFEQTKPPSAECIEKAWSGIGVQGLVIADGQVRESVLGADAGVCDSQTFIGMDAERKILWLIAFQNTSPRYAADFVAAAGVRFAGRLDGGDSTTMLVGPAAERVNPFGGIRRSRFIGNYIAVRRSQE
jgi:hypothetical protein